MSLGPCTPARIYIERELLNGVLFRIQSNYGHISLSAWGIENLENDDTTLTRDELTNLCLIFIHI